MWLLLVVLLSAPVWSCGKGCIEWKDSCACEVLPEGPEPVKPSDEKLPKDRMPSYQREGIKVIDIPSLASQDEKYDREKADALEEGKKLAGIK